MRITSKMTAQGYIKTVRKTFKKGDVLKDIILRSAKESVDAAKEANPELVKAAVDYIEYAEKMVKRGYVPSQSGIIEETSEERKALAKAFTLDTEEKRKLFKPDWWLTGYNLFVYHLLEAVFDASLLVEQGAERKFCELMELYRSFFKVEESLCNYFCLYGSKVVYINAQKGQIYTSNVNNPAIRDRVKRFGIKGFKRVSDSRGVSYWLEYGNKDATLLMRNGCVSSSLKKEHTLKDHKKAYYQVILQRDEDTSKPSVQFPAHILIMLATYGIDAIKQTICKDSIITCDHVDSCGNNNEKANLQLVARRDNVLRAKSKDAEVLRNVYGYDLGKFYEHIANSFLMDKGEAKFQADYTREYWEKVLEKHSWKEILTV